MDNAVIGSIRTLNSIVDIQNDIKDIGLIIKEGIVRIKGETQKGD